MCRIRELLFKKVNRTIKVKKSELIETLKRHKENHIIEYDKAVKAYKLETLEQLKKLLENAENDKLNLKLNLTEPINNIKNYDKIISMFEWEVEDFVELDQDEFKEYVLDENRFTEQAKISNVLYFAKFGL